MSSDEAWGAVRACVARRRFVRAAAVFRAHTGGGMTAPERAALWAYIREAWEQARAQCPPPASRREWMESVIAADDLFRDHLFSEDSPSNCWDPRIRDLLVLTASVAGGWVPFRLGTAEAHFANPQREVRAYFSPARAPLLWFDFQHGTAFQPSPHDSSSAESRHYATLHLDFRQEVNPDAFPSWWLAPVPWESSPELIRIRSLLRARFGEEEHEEAARPLPQSPGDAPS